MALVVPSGAIWPQQSLVKMQKLESSRQRKHALKRNERILASFKDPKWNMGKSAALAFKADGGMWSHVVNGKACIPRTLHIPDTRGILEWTDPKTPAALQFKPAPETLHHHQPRRAKYATKAGSASQKNGKQVPRRPTPPTGKLRTVSTESQKATTPGYREHRRLLRESRDWGKCASPVEEWALHESQWEKDAVVESRMRKTSRGTPPRPSRHPPSPPVAEEGVELELNHGKKVRISPDERGCTDTTPRGKNTETDTEAPLLNQPTTPISSLDRVCLQMDQISALSRERGITMGAAARIVPPRAPTFGQQNPALDPRRFLFESRSSTDALLGKATRRTSDTSRRKRHFRVSIRSNETKTTPSTSKKQNPAYVLTGISPSMYRKRRLEATTAFKDTVEILPYPKRADDVSLKDEKHKDVYVSSDSLSNSRTSTDTESVYVWSDTVSYARGSMESAAPLSKTSSISSSTKENSISGKEKKSERPSFPERRSSLGISLKAAGFSEAKDESYPVASLSNQTEAQTSAKKARFEGLDTKTVGVATRPSKFALASERTAARTSAKETRVEDIGKETDGFHKETSKANPFSKKAVYDLSMTKTHPFRCRRPVPKSRVERIETDAFAAMKSSDFSTEQLIKEGILVSSPASRKTSRAYDTENPIEEGVAAPPASPSPMRRPSALQRRPAIRKSSAPVSKYYYRRPSLRNAVSSPAVPTAARRTLPERRGTRGRPTLTDIVSASEAPATARSWEGRYTDLPTLHRRPTLGDLVEEMKKRNFPISPPPDGPLPPVPPIPARYSNSVNRESILTPPVGNAFARTGYWADSARNRSTSTLVQGPVEITPHSRDSFGSNVSNLSSQSIPTLVPAPDENAPTVRNCSSIRVSKTQTRSAATLSSSYQQVEPPSDGYGRNSTASTLVPPSIAPQCKEEERSRYLASLKQLIAIDPKNPAGYQPFPEFKALSDPSSQSAFKWVCEVLNNQYAQSQLPPPPPKELPAGAPEPWTRWEHLPPPKTPVRETPNPKYYHGMGYNFGMTVPPTPRASRSPMDKQSSSSTWKLSLRGKASRTNLKKTESQVSLARLTIAPPATDSSAAPLPPAANVSSLPNPEVIGKKRRKPDAQAPELHECFEKAYKVSQALVERLMENVVADTKYLSFLDYVDRRPIKLMKKVTGFAGEEIGVCEQYFIDTLQHVETWKFDVEPAEQQKKVKFGIVKTRREVPEENFEFETMLERQRDAYTMMHRRRKLTDLTSMDPEHRLIWAVEFMIRTKQKLDLEKLRYQESMVTYLEMEALREAMESGLSQRESDQMSVETREGVETMRNHYLRRMKSDETIRDQALRSMPSDETIRGTRAESPFSSNPTLRSIRDVSRQASVEFGSPPPFSPDPTTTLPSIRDLYREKRIDLGSPGPAIRGSDATLGSNQLDSRFSNNPTLRSARQPSQQPSLQSSVWTAPSTLDLGRDPFRYDDFLQFGQSVQRMSQQASMEFGSPPLCGETDAEARRRRRNTPFNMGFTPPSFIDELTDFIAEKADFTGKQADPFIQDEPSLVNDVCEQPVTPPTTARRIRHRRTQGMDIRHPILEEEPTLVNDLSEPLAKTPTKARLVDQKRFKGMEERHFSIEAPDDSDWAAELGRALAKEKERQGKEEVVRTVRRDPTFEMGNKFLARKWDQEDGGRRPF